MKRRFRRKVDAKLLPELAPLGFSITHVEGSIWDAVAVAIELTAEDLVVRLALERGWYEASFAAVHDPSEWWSFHEVAAWMGSRADRPDGTSPDELIRCVGAFIRAEWDGLRARFSPQSYADTKEQLAAVRRVMNKNLIRDTPSRKNKPAE